MKGKKGVMGPKEVLKIIRASSIRFQALRIILCGSMLCPLGQIGRQPPRVGLEGISSAQTSASVPLPSGSFFFHFMLPLPLLVQASSDSVDIKFSKIRQTPVQFREVQTIRQEGPSRSIPGEPHLYSQLLLTWFIGSISHTAELFSK